MKKLIEHAPQEMLLILSPDLRFRRITSQNMKLLLGKYRIAEQPVHFKKQRGTGFIDLYIFKLRRAVL